MMIIRLKLLISFLVIVCLLVITQFSNGYQEYHLAQEKLLLLHRVQVKKVIDGDTFLTTDGRMVRFIGIDCPEVDYRQGDDEYFAREAFEYTRQVLEGNKVFLEYDASLEDDYGRVLAYVFLADGTFFNARLLREGYARLFIVPPDIKYLELFKKATREAREEFRGLWGWWESILLPVISWQEAEDYFGQEVIVKGKIVNTFDTGEVIFLNFHPEFWDTLSVVIFDEELNKFDYNPVEYLLDKEVMIKGQVREYNGVPEIIVDDPLQVFLMKESEVLW
jgi:micrococcal nuclease